MLYSWTTRLFDRVLRGREHIVINMDETALPRLITRRAGNVAAVQSGASRAQLFERVSRQESHGHVTLVACIASAAALQRYLPQLLLTKDSRLSALETETLRGLREPWCGSAARPCYLRVYACSCPIHAFCNCLPTQRMWL